MLLLNSCIYTTETEVEALEEDEEFHTANFEFLG
jgi:hypothetical protein